MAGPVTCTTAHHRAGVEVQGQDTRPDGGASIEYQILILNLILNTRDLSGPMSKSRQGRETRQGREGREGRPGKESRSRELACISSPGSSKKNHWGPGLELGTTFQA